MTPRRDLVFLGLAFAGFLLLLAAVISRLHGPEVLRYEDVQHELRAGPDGGRDI